LLRHRPKVVLLGSMCLLPVPGVVYQVLHYLLGLESLGFEAYYVETHGLWVKHPEGERDDIGAPKVPVAQTMRDYGFSDRWICRTRHAPGPAVFGGFPPERLPQLYADAAAVLNVTGTHLIDEDMAACDTRIYLETDPGIPQIRLHAGDPRQVALVAGHTHHRTFGELVGTRRSRLPEVPVAYAPTRQPVVLDLWQRPAAVPGDHLTTIAGWMRPKSKDISFAGETYHWDKRHAFGTFVDLPRRTGATFCLALARADAADMTAWRGSGWLVREAAEWSSLASYRDFIIGSRGEFTAAKDQYVRLRTGWFSDRSACYLAAGRPVITQDTGFPSCLPTGEGLLTFRTVDEAVACVEELRADYPRHAAAALEIAREYFDARRVLTDLLQGCGVEVPYALAGRARPNGRHTPSPS
jgi:hypothetical protein